MILGKHLEQMNEQERGRFRRDHIGFIFQAYNLLPQFSSWENVAVPLEIRGIPLEQRREKAMEALEMVGLRDHAEHRPTELSGGQQQRISIARAIITRPGIVFADEPTGNLDSRTGTEVMSLLTDLFRRWGTTFLVVSHDEDMNRYTDREIRLKDGKNRKNIFTGGMLRMKSPVIKRLLPFALALCLTCGSSLSAYAAEAKDAGSADI